MSLYLFDNDFEMLLLLYTLIHHNKRFNDIILLEFVISCIISEKKCFTNHSHDDIMPDHVKLSKLSRSVKLFDKVIYMALMLEQKHEDIYQKKNVWNLIEKGSDNEIVHNSKDSD